MSGNEHKHDDDAKQDSQALANALLDPQAPIAVPLDDESVPLSFAVDKRLDSSWIVLRLGTNGTSGQYSQLTSWSGKTANCAHWPCVHAPLSDALPRGTSYKGYVATCHADLAASRTAPGGNTKTALAHDWGMRVHVRENADAALMPHALFSGQPCVTPEGRSVLLGFEWLPSDDSLQLGQLLHKTKAVRVDRAQLFRQNASDLPWSTVAVVVAAQTFTVLHRLHALRINYRLATLDAFKVLRCDAHSVQRCARAEDADVCRALGASTLSGLPNAGLIVVPDDYRLSILYDAQNSPVRIWTFDAQLWKDQTAKRDAWRQRNDKCDLQRMLRAWREAVIDDKSARALVRRFCDALEKFDFDVTQAFAVIQA